MNARSVLVALLALATHAAAGSLDARHVSADAPWVLHVDFEALSRSTLLCTLHESGQHIENDLDADQIRSTFGLDPLSDLSSMTMYAVAPRGGGVAAVVIGTEKLESAWRRLATKAQPVNSAGRDACWRGEGASFPYISLLPAREGSPRMALIAPLAAARGATDVARRLATLLAPLRIASAASRLEVGYRYGTGKFVVDVLFAERGVAGQPKH